MTSFKKISEKEAKQMKNAVIKENKVFDETTGDLLGEIEQVEVKSVRNKVIEKVLFMGAKVSGKGNKIGISVLRYDYIDDRTGQVSSQKESPYITAWLDYDENSAYKALLNYKPMTEIYVALSGDGSFVSMHKVFSKAEAELFTNYIN